MIEDTGVCKKTQHRRHIGNAEDDEIVEIEGLVGRGNIPAVIESREEMARMETLDLRNKLSGASSTIHSTGGNS